MRRRVVRDHDGNAVTAEDVLDPEEAAEYRRQHPRPPVHQMRFYPAPVNECDCCHDDIPAELGAFCGGDHCLRAEVEFDRWLERHNDISSED